jgi:transcriptional regulator GlxA family with amidase domain
MSPVGLKVAQRGELILNPLWHRGGLPIARLRKIEDYVHAHLAESISIETLAELAELRPFHFSRVFKQHIRGTKEGDTRSDRARLAACKEAVDRSDPGHNEAASP